MSGVEFDVTSKANHDKYLTEDSCASFFYPSYTRHTNFATEVVEHGFSGSEEFGKTIRCEFTGTGDMLASMFLHVTIPEIRYIGTEQDRDSARFAWVEDLGHALIQEATMLIGSREIVLHSGEWMNIHCQLFTTASQMPGVNKMIGNVPELTSLSQLEQNGSDVLKKSYDLCIPFYFFCKDVSKAVPLCALGTNRVGITVKLRPISQLCIKSDSVIIENKLPLSASILATHINLEKTEAMRIACFPRETLIDQVQTLGPITIPGDAGSFATDFSFPVRSLYWNIRNDNYYGGKFMAYDANNWELARDLMARHLLLAEFDLDKFGYANKAIASGVKQVYVGQNGISYEAFDPRDVNEESGFIFADSVTESQFGGDNFLGRLSEGTNLLAYESKQKSLKTHVYDLRSKVNGVIRISSDPNDPQNISLEVALITYNSLTMRDLSTNLSYYSVDNRNQYVAARDVTVWQHNNTGLYIDGTVNPIAEASLSVNGHSRQISPYPGWFGPVEAYLHCTSTPKDGVESYHFELAANSAQPSGSSNFSAHTGAKIQVQRIKIPGVTSDKDVFTMYANSYQVLSIHEQKVDTLFKS